MGQTPRDSKTVKFMSSLSWTFSAARCSWAAACTRLSLDLGYKTVRLAANRNVVRSRLMFIECRRAFSSVGQRSRVTGFMLGLLGVKVFATLRGGAWKAVALSFAVKPQSGLLPHRESRG